MDILVCVKRVPTVGGKIAVTPDGQEVDTRASGFSISPHEECAVEEAVQITERLGGTVSVLTLGPEAAVEQLRDALALGAHRAVLLETDGREFGPIATAAAIAAEVRAHPYDLVLLGNEAADTGDYQVGVRLAHELGWPVATGIKNLSCRWMAWSPGASTAAWRRRIHFPCPRWSPSRRASTCRGTRRCPGGCGPSGPRSSGPRPAGRRRGCARRRSGCPSRASTRPTVLGDGAEAVPELVRVLDELGGAVMTRAVSLGRTGRRPSRPTPRCGR